MIQEKRDGLLGQLFALSAIVTGKVSVDDEARENTELTLEITEHLLSLAKKKVFLREPAITVLLHLIDKVFLFFYVDKLKWKNYVTCRKYWYRTPMYLLSYFHLRMVILRINSLGINILCRCNWCIT